MNWRRCFRALRLEALLRQIIVRFDRPLTDNRTHLTTVNDFHGARRLLLVLLLQGALHLTEGEILERLHVLLLLLLLMMIMLLSFRP